MLVMMYIQILKKIFLWLNHMQQKVFQQELQLLFRANIIFKLKKKVLLQKWESKNLVV